MQILCNIRGWADYSCTTLIKSANRKNGIYILKIGGIDSSINEMEIKSFNRITFSSTTDFELGGVGFHHKDYYPSEGMSGYNYNYDAKTVYFSAHG